MLITQEKNPSVRSVIGKNRIFKSGLTNEFKMVKTNETNSKLKKLGLMVKPGSIWTVVNIARTLITKTRINDFIFLSLT